MEFVLHDHGFGTGEVNIKAKNHELTLFKQVEEMKIN